MDKIFEYDPVIWPRKLFVVIGEDIGYIQDHFIKTDGTAYPISKDIKNDSDVVTFPEVEKRDDGYFGELVWCHSPEKVTDPFICHEAIHAANGMLGACGVEITTDNDEALTYTAQFCFESIKKAISEAKVS